MNEETLIEWKNELESRIDLMHFHKNKELDVCVVQEDKEYCLSFHFGKILVNQPIHEQSDVIIETSEEVIDGLLNGDQKLSNIPEQFAKVSGRFKDVLFLESVFYLLSSDISIKY